MLKNINAAIFDLDGTLVDSMWVWEKIDIEFLKAREIQTPKNLMSEICHLTFEQTANCFKSRFNLLESTQEIMDEWNAMAYDHYKNDVKLKPGAKELLLTLKKLNIKIALATSNCRQLLEITLKSNGIFDLFDIISTTDEVSRGKDFPDIYLLSAKKLNVAPNECIVFEDILKAVYGAKLAGMHVVGVKDHFSQSESKQIKECSDRYINDFVGFAI